MVDKKASSEDDIVLEDELDEASPHDIELEEDEMLKEEKMGTLRVKLKACEAEKMLALEEKERVRADFLNSKRRIEEQFAIDKERIIEKTLINFLPLLDTFDSALTQKEESAQGEWKKGIEAMQSLFQGILKSYDIEEIETDGKQFNPYEHEAVGNIPTDKLEHIDIILQVLQKGYKRKDTILRPAKVLIGA